MKAHIFSNASTVEFHITAKGSQASPNYWRPRRFRNPVNREFVQHIIARIKELGVHGGEREAITIGRVLNANLFDPTSYLIRANL